MRGLVPHRNGTSGCFSGMFVCGSGCQLEEASRRPQTLRVTGRLPQWGRRRRAGGPQGGDRRDSPRQRDEHRQGRNVRRCIAAQHSGPYGVLGLRALSGSAQGTWSTMVTVLRPARARGLALRVGPRIKAGPLGRRPFLIQ